MPRLPLMSAAMAFLLLSPAASRAETGDCFRLEYDPVERKRPDWTLTEAEHWTLIWSRDGQVTRLITGSGGSGIPVRVAAEPDGTLHSYRYLDGKLIFDMEVYEPGCD